MFVELLPFFVAQVKLSFKYFEEIGRVKEPPPIFRVLTHRNIPYNTKQTAVNIASSKCSPTLGLVTHISIDLG